MAEIIRLYPEAVEPQSSGIVPENLSARLRERLSFQRMLLTAANCLITHKITSAAQLKGNKRLVAGIVIATSLSFLEQAAHKVGTNIAIATSEIYQDVNRR